MIRACAGSQPGHDECVDWRVKCPTPTIPNSAPSSLSIPPPISRSRISPTACFRPRTAWPRASASRSAITCSISGSSQQDCRIDVVEPGGVRRTAAQCVHGVGAKGLVEDPRADQRVVAARSSGAARQRKACASARWCRWRMSNCICRSRSPATPISIRRRSTPPMSASCSAARTTRCSRTGCTCRSAITAARRPSLSAAPKCAGRAGS